MSDAPPVGWCEIEGCGRRALFVDEFKCYRHARGANPSPVTRVVVHLADGQRVELGRTGAP